jgi:anti-sigma regulatory factor (Ser/Thr protein kinase)
MITAARCGAGESGNDRELKLDPEPSSVRKARDFVAKRLTELGFPRSVEDGILIASELVTNAQKAAPEMPCLLAVRVDAAYHPVIEVHDSCPEPPELKDPGFFSEEGRGLHIVEAVCETWDCVTSGHGKVIIATLRR